MRSPYKVMCCNKVFEEEYWNAYTSKHGTCYNCNNRIDIRHGSKDNPSLIQINKLRIDLKKIALETQDGLRNELYVKINRDFGYGYVSRYLWFWFHKSFIYYLLNCLNYVIFDRWNYLTNIMSVVYLEEWFCWLLYLLSDNDRENSSCAVLLGIDFPKRYLFKIPLRKRVFHFNIYRFFDPSVYVSS